MKNIKIISLLFILLAVFSCSKKNEDSTVVGDVIAISKKSGSNTVYALAYYAYAYSPLKEVTVTKLTDTSTKVTLAAAEVDYTTTFRKEPEDEDFTTTKPATDTFRFNAVFESGNTYQADDNLSSTILEPSTFEKCSYNTEKSYAEISWTAVTNADSYSVSIFDDKQALVFRSAELSNTVTSGTLSSSTSGWITQPVNGKVYTVRVAAFKYEDSNSPNSLHLQSSSVLESTITWGQ